MRRDSVGVLSFLTTLNQQSQFFSLILLLLLILPNFWMGISPLLDLLGELGDQHGYSPGEEAEHAIATRSEPHIICS